MSGDSERAERIALGDRSALAEAYDLYAGPCYRHALAILGSAPDAEDVLQEVFLKLVRRRGGRIRDLKAYLLVSSRNEAYSLLRYRQRESAGLLHQVAAPVGRQPGVASRSELLEALADLPPEQREVVVLKACEQMTFEEVARLVGISVNTAASRYRYALKKLRGLLEEPANAG